MEIVIAVVFIVGIILGGFLASVFSKLRSVGTILLDINDPYDSPSLFLELSTDVSTFENRKFVTLQIHKEKRKKPSQK